MSDLLLNEEFCKNKTKMLRGYIYLEVVNVYLLGNSIRRQKANDRVLTQKTRDSAIYSTKKGRGVLLNQIK